MFGKKKYVYKTHTHTQTQKKERKRKRKEKEKIKKKKHDILRCEIKISRRNKVNPHMGKAKSYYL